MCWGCHRTRPRERSAWRRGPSEASATAPSRRSAKAWENEMTLEHDFDPDLARRLEARLAPYAPVGRISPPLPRPQSRWRRGSDDAEQDPSSLTDRQRRPRAPRWAAVNVATDHP